jgi:hypothetical protein
MRLTLATLLIAAILVVTPAVAEQTASAPPQPESKKAPTLALGQYDPQTTPTPRTPWQYDPQPEPTPRTPWQYEREPTPVPHTSPVTSVAWMNPTTGDIYIGVEFSTRAGNESPAFAYDLDANALREIGFVIHREVYTVPGAPPCWNNRAGVNAVYSASFAGGDGYVVVLTNGPRVCIVGVANISGGEIDAKAATDYMESVARLGVRYRPPGEFVETPIT